MAITIAAQPQATWLERRHDFGVFKEADGKVSYPLRLVNTGNEPLLIVKVQAGCGCTAINYPEAPIAPGDTAAVTLTYNPSGRPGQFSKQALIFCNTEPKRTVLEITGNVIPTDVTLDKQYPIRAGSLRVSQGSIPFGELTSGKNKTLYLSAYNASTDTLLVSVTGSKPHIRPAVVPDTVPPARVTALTVHYMSKYAPLWGFNIDTLTLVSQALHQPSQAVAGTATVNVMAQVMENFSALTDQQRRDAPIAITDCGETLDFGSIAKGEKATRTFQISNRGKERLIIRRLWAPDGEGVTINVSQQEVKRGKKAIATVTVDTSKIDGDMLNIPLTLLCNDPETPRQTIRLVGLIDKQ